MQKTLFKKYLRITSLIIVISFFMLGFVMLMFLSLFGPHGKQLILFKQKEPKDV